MIPTLVTERLTLRPPRASDIDAYAAMRADPVRMAHVGGAQDRTRAWHHLCGVAGQWTLRGFGKWVVTETGQDVALGVVGPFYPDDWPEPEIGWTIAAAAEGRGIAFEAALAARRYAYGTLGWGTAISCVAPGNARSEALARRLGCVPERSLDHPILGEMNVWRHPAPEAAA